MHETKHPQKADKRRMMQRSQTIKKKKYILINIIIQTSNQLKLTKNTTYNETMTVITFKVLEPQCLKKDSCNCKLNSEKFVRHRALNAVSNLK